MINWTFCGTFSRSFSFRLLTSIVAGIICIPGFTFAQRPMPIENGVLRSNLDAAGFSITNLTAAGNGTFNGTFTGNGTGLSLPGNLVYTDVANQTITGNLTVAKDILGDPTNELSSNLTIKASGLSYTGSQANNEYNVTGFQSYTNTLSAQPSLSGVVVASEEYTSDGGVSDFKTTLKVSPYELRLSAQDVQNAIASNMTLTYGGLVLPQSVSSTTGNLALSGTNLTLDTGDIALNGGDINQIGALTGTGTNAFGGGNITLGNNTIIFKARAIFNTSFTFGLYLDATTARLGGGGATAATLESAGTTSIQAANTSYTISAANNIFSSSTPSYPIYEFWTAPTSRKFKRYRSGDNLNILWGDNSEVATDAIVFENNITVNANRTLTIPANVTTNNTVFTGTSSFQGTFAFRQRVNHDVDIVSNGTITNQMSFVKVTATGNQTLPDGTSGDWIQIKNYSGGAITLLPTGAETFDGNASLTLNDKEAVDLTSDGTIWMIH